MSEKDTDALTQQLSEIYYPLEMKSYQILRGLQHHIFEPQLAYYSGHHRKSTDDSLSIDYFPLPVITIESLCNVVIDLDCVIVNSKLRREAAFAFAYEQLEHYEFEIRREDNDAICHHLSDAVTAPVREAVFKSRKKNLEFSF